MTTAQLDRMPHEFRKKQFLCPWLEEQWFWASNSKGSRPGEMQQKNWQNPKMAEKVLLVRTSPKVGWLYDTFGLWAVSCAFAQSAILFVGWRVEQTTRTKLLLLKLSKINPIISLGFPKKSKTMVVWRVTYHLDYCSFSLSLSLWVFSEQTRKWSGSSRPTDLWKRKDYSPQIHIIRLSSSFSITIPTGKTPRKRNHEKCYKSPE